MTELGTITDLSKTFACRDEFIYSNLYVFEGDLYADTTKITTSGKVTWVTGRTTSSSYYSYYIEDGKLMRLTSSLVTSQVGTDTTWTKCCGYTSTSSTGKERAFVLNSTGLYFIDRNNNLTLASDITDWDMIYGYGETGTANYFGYGISQGKLYYLYANGSGAVQQGTDTTWSKVGASYENGSWYGLGINGGKLYRLKTTQEQIGSDTTWTDIGCGGVSSSFKPPAINNGALYNISSSDTNLVDNTQTWLKCSGFSTTALHSLAYSTSGLYGITSNQNMTLLDSGNYVYCGENYDSTAIAIAIKRV